ncbi:MAG TPA: GNAT family N-acetyltransferase [Methylomirabilota bacterium]|nr:GNAT family N-acetyltransferase [Methylomirabilota bacterium]
MTGAVGSEVTLRVVDDWREVLAMGPAWNRLLAESPQRANVFLTHEWFRAWWEGFGEGRVPQVVTLHAGGRLIGIAPLMRSRVSYHGLPVRLLSLIANDHTNRCELILAERPRECVEAVLDFVRRQAPRWDMAELDFLPADSPTARGVAEAAAAYGLACGERPSYRSPFIPLEGTWESFYGGLDGRFRRNLRNREKRLAALGPVTYEDHPSTLHAALQEMFVVGERSWKGEAKTALGSTPALCRFYTRLAELAEPRGELSLHVLRVGGKAIAFHYSLRTNGTVHLLKTEYDTDYHPYSPGHQIQKRVLEACYARGMREFDFLGPDMEWKREWASRVRPHVRLLLFHGGPRSRLLAFLELRAKPALKQSKLVRWLRRTEPVDVTAEATCS